MAAGSAKASAHVSVTIGGRAFRLACNPGDEPHLEALARDVDARIGDMRKSFGEIGDQRLVVMAALTIADELAETKRTLASLEQRAAVAIEAEGAAREEVEELSRAMTEALGEATHRIENLASALAGPLK
jgi:cell division protein ZapA